MLYQFAYAHNEDIIFYFDQNGNKYVASGGNLAWRINNPGLVRSHSHFARSNGAIGSCNGYAIFSHPAEGHKALSRWLHSKKYYQSTLKTIAKHDHPNNFAAFVEQISNITQIENDRKIKSLHKTEFECLLIALEKLCGYVSTGTESLSLLPKIIAKIEYPNQQEEKYLIGDTIILSKEEATEWILSHRLDGVIVHESSGALHLRSRPNHCIWNIKMHEAILPSVVGQIDTLLRVVGEKKPNQCIWAFINGVSNTKNDALTSAELISKAAQGDCILAMQNDSVL